MRTGSIRNVLAEARAEAGLGRDAAVHASLRFPSRPYTPAEPSRALFCDTDYGAWRPQTGSSVTSALRRVSASAPSVVDILRIDDEGDGEENNASGAVAFDDGSDAVGCATSGRRSPARVQPVGAVDSTPPPSTEQLSPWGDKDGPVSGSVDDAPLSLSGDADDASPVPIRLVTRNAALEALAAATRGIEAMQPTLRCSSKVELLTACGAAFPSVRAYALAQAKVVSLWPDLVTGRGTVEDVPESVLTRMRDADGVRSMVLQTVLSSVPRDAVLADDTGLVLKLCGLALMLSDADSRVMSAFVADKVSDDTVRDAASIVCGTLFSLSKDARNDRAFSNEGVLLPLLQFVERAPGGVVTDTDELEPSCGMLFPMLDPNALLYATGVLKNVSNCLENQAFLVQNGAVSVCTVLVRVIGASTSEHSPSARRLAEILVQVTGCLRNLALGKRHLRPFWVCGAVDALLGALRRFGRHAELCLNVMRIVGKLSLQDACRSRLSETPLYLERLVQILVVHNLDAPILVRACFVLGNLTATNSANRRRLANDLGIVPPLFEVLVHFADEFCALPASTQHGGKPRGGDDDGRASSVEDVVVKAVRVVAHLAIEGDVGARLCVTRGVDVFVRLLKAADVERNEELLLNVVSAVTNLSFSCFVASEPYGEGPPCASLTSSCDDIACSLAPLLVHTSEEAVLEAARAFGNLSRFHSVRGLMVTTRVLDALVLLLYRTNVDTVQAVCGALMNVVAEDDAKRAVRASEPGLNGLVHLLQRARNVDVGLTTLACKTLYNYALGWDELHAAPRFDAEQCIALSICLEDVIGGEESGDDDDASGGAESDDRGATRECRSVARRLRRVIQGITSRGLIDDDSDADRGK